MAKQRKNPAGAEYHEPFDLLPESVRDHHRLLKALAEEVEAIDWYNQRSAVTLDDQAVSVLDHFRDEEIEHACMALEWLRRNMPGWDEAMRKILFTDDRECIGDRCLRLHEAKKSRSAASRLLRNTRNG